MARIKDGVGYYSSFTFQLLRFVYNLSFIMFDTRRFFEQGWPVRVMLGCGRGLPLWGASVLATVGAQMILWLKPDVYHGVRANLRHVLGTDVSEHDLRATMRRLFFNLVRRYYELFYNLGRGRRRMAEFTPRACFTEAAQGHIAQALAQGRGLFLLACHMANFDMTGIATAQFMPVPLLVLSLATPSLDIEMMNDLRRECGAPMTPVSSEALRDAIGYLRKGHAVVTGPDYPVRGNDAPVMFFGAPAYLPTGYLRIPLRTGSPVMVLTTHYKDGVYWIDATPPLDLEKTGDRQQDVIVNMRRVLEVMESFIGQHPEEWMMVLPVWKD